MITFNDLRISEDKNCLTVDCSVTDADGYIGMYIDSIYVEYYKTAMDDGSPSEHAIELYSRDNDTEDRRNVRRTLNKSDLNKESFGTDTFDAGIFFVTVRCDGTPENAAVLAQYPCGADSLVAVGLAVDWKIVYEKGMAFVSKFNGGLYDKCMNNDGFEQFILFWYAFQLAVSSCDWYQVKQMWPLFLRMLSVGGGRGSHKGCGCSGK